MKALFEKSELERYLSGLYGDRVKLITKSTTPPGAEPSSGPKGFGYGQPLFLEFTHGDRRQTAVFETMKPDHFGHEYLADRAQNVILAHSTFNNLPKHTRSLDAGIVTKDHRLASVGDAEEYFQLVRFADGHEYFHDLEHLKKAKKFTQLDLKRASALADYLATIHREKTAKPELYVRRIRELVGHGECIMGLTDSYPTQGNFVSQNELEEIESKCISWRWKLKRRTHRLSRVHGDFHPWNLLFRKGADFSVIDRSRGEWGEPADDVAALTINYLFYSLQTFGSIRDPFLRLWKTFHARYYARTKDDELYAVIQPFYAWRGLVIASPIWYPNLSRGIRRSIFNFIHNCLATDRFDYEKLAAYLRTPQS